LEKKAAIRNAKDFEEILEIEYGKVGSQPRNEFEENAQYFIISELLKDARREVNKASKKSIA